MITLEINGYEHSFDLDLGDQHYAQYTRWAPDRELNPQYAHLPDVEKLGLLIAHPNLKEIGKWCMSGIHFDLEIMREVFKEKVGWIVHSWEPLTLSPSLLCCACGDHGFIREGKWVKA